MYDDELVTKAYAMSALIQSTSNLTVKKEDTANLLDELAHRVKELNIRADRYEKCFDEAAKRVYKLERKIRKLKKKNHEK